MTSLATNSLLLSLD
uniref:Uncharacterized protein n=1 Tax=Anguilla anguilla TaxID=7936 RepID=A0A0E9U4U9_ANGAN